MYRLVSCYGNLRTALLLGCSAGFCLTALESHALAGDNAPNPSLNYITTSQGSEPIHRPQVDTWPGQVYIYTGGFLPVGAHPASFQYVFDSTEEGNTTGFITPVLLESSSVEAFTVYRVVGIARSFRVQLNSGVQRIPFTMLEGIKMATQGNVTFGFINAAVDSNGVPIATSPGTVDMESPAHDGDGVGGPGTTNDWAATANADTPNPVVTLGTTFGASGAKVDFTFLAPDRTYSVQAWVTVVTQ
jgi:hypothetical protein